MTEEQILVSKIKYYLVDKNCRMHETTMFANAKQASMKLANMEFHPTLNKKIFMDESYMFANGTQTPMKIVNMEFHPILNKKLFTNEIKVMKTIIFVQ